MLLISYLFCHSVHVSLLWELLYFLFIYIYIFLGWWEMAAVTSAFLMRWCGFKNWLCCLSVALDLYEIHAEVRKFALFQVICYLMVLPRKHCGRSWVRAPAGAIVRRVFHPTRKLVRFSLLKCPSILILKNSEIRSPRGEV